MYNVHFIHIHYSYIIHVCIFTEEHWAQGTLICVWGCCVVLAMCEYEKMTIAWKVAILICILIQNKQFH